jgi:hypothetical protein
MTCQYYKGQTSWCLRDAHYGRYWWEQNLCFKHTAWWRANMLAIRERQARICTSQSQDPVSSGDGRRHMRVDIVITGIRPEEMVMWRELHAKTIGWHHQSFNDWLITLIGAKSRESAELWKYSQRPGGP